MLFLGDVTLNNVSSKGEGGGQKCRNLLSKKTTKGDGGGQKIEKMGQRYLWMAPNMEFKMQNF